jgi:glucose 1-dehydrogenase
MLTKAMAVDLAEHGIRANMIAPGPIRVDHNAALFDSESMRAGFVKSVPLGGQPGSGDDIAGAAVYFASDDSRFATGASLVIDGGATAIFRHD